MRFVNKKIQVISSSDKFVHITYQVEIPQANNLSYRLIGRVVRMSDHCWTFQTRTAWHSSPGKFETGFYSAVSEERYGTRNEAGKRVLEEYKKAISKGEPK